jgi:glucose/arabinose dehydrogenase
VASYLQNLKADAVNATLNNQKNTKQMNQKFFPTFGYSIYTLYYCIALKNTHVSFYCLLIILFSNFLFAQTPTLATQSFVTDFTRPTDVESAGDVRLFVAEIGGKIKIINNGSVLSTAFLDIGNKVNDPDWSGIFSIAFHPNYTQNGKFYVLYVRKPDAFVQLSQFSRSIADSNQADSTETPILTIPYSSPTGHRGGEIAFGADGYLYITTGDDADGGRGIIGDPNNNAQNLSLWFGKILRIDVNGSLPYTIPATNPYQTPGDNIPDEIWARGLRNPWRMSFDRVVGDLWLGDNGQDGWEEVSFLANNAADGANFGWRCYEGNHRYPYQSVCDDSTSMVFPIYEYAGYNNNGGTGASVIGGYVYRGKKYPALYGHFVYGDYATNQIRTLRRNPNGTVTNAQQSPILSRIVSFGQDWEGELYAVTFFEGTLYKITAETCPPTQTLTVLDPVKDNVVFNAATKIEAGSVVRSQAIAVYNAGSTIDLLPGFCAETGSVFSTQLTGCPTTNSLSVR